MQHIRLVKISNYGLFHGVLDLLLASFTQSCQSIEWSECDDLLMTSVSLYFPGASYFTTDTAHGYVLIKTTSSAIYLTSTHKSLALSQDDQYRLRKIAGRRF